jgi:hypothetical protein
MVQTFSVVIYEELNKNLALRESQSTEEEHNHKREALRECQRAEEHNPQRESIIQ